LIIYQKSSDKYKDRDCKKKDETNAGFSPYCNCCPRCRQD